MGRAKEPASLRRWKREHPDAGPAAWDGLPKGEIAATLHREQHGRCGYCARALPPVEGAHPNWRLPRRPSDGQAAVSIEHVFPKSRPGPDGSHAHTWAWENLALVCDGGSPSEPHCDRSKGHQILAIIHPTRQPVPRHTRLGSNGRLRCTETNAEADVDVVLRLNAPSLVRLRQNTLRGLQRALGPTHWKPERIGAMRDDLPIGSDFHPHVVEWLDRQAQHR